jgi:hypothetical protein
MVALSEDKRLWRCLSRSIEQQQRGELTQHVAILQASEEDQAGRPARLVQLRRG